MGQLLVKIQEEVQELENEKEQLEDENKHEKIKLDELNDVYQEK